MSEPRLETVMWDALNARNGGETIDDNPHTEGSEEWWYWRLTWLSDEERREHDESLPIQAERAISEQPRWERRERLGVNDLVRRVQFRAEALGRWYGLMDCVPPVFLAEARKQMLKAVERLIAVDPNAGEES